MPKSKGWLQLQMRVGDLESLLNTEYHIFENKQTTRQYLGSEKYHLPAEIAEHMDMITPAVSMYTLAGTERAGSSVARCAIDMADAELQSNDAKPCGDTVTHEYIKTMYKIPDAPAKANPNNVMGLFESGLSRPNQTDHDAYYKLANLKIPAGFGAKVDMINFDNTSHVSTSPEMQLDMEAAYPIFYPQNIKVFQMNNTKSDLYNHFLDAIGGSFCDVPNPDPDTGAHVCGGYKAPNVLSISYNLVEDAYSLKQSIRQCNEWMKLGLQGTSVFHSTGDTGVAGPFLGFCSGKDSAVFNAATQVACPYITTVDGTELPRGADASMPQQVANLSYSGGGGFSNYFPRPSYQDAAVSEYLKNHARAFPSYNKTDGTLPADGSNGVFNRGGRAFLVLSAVSARGFIYIYGKTHLTGGTSVSTPIVGAMFNLINENRLAAGKSVVGFVNPALYKNPAMFNDITHGGIRKDEGFACNGNSFDATPGWDAASRLGTPTFPVMSKYFMSL
ncbi:hypothetical protein VHEMI01572 [[Torrubiella] hemipterigena]|uniref:Peptidase S53 domain-containing protein n=1 Tax=[Torrubiella] hemipterigena TaxID=1531966 RepID=A0A0A1T5R2_9HYPO|nr:hypothetical protein VHEMI01572 [[Torrubiella] hemipterigena]